MDTFHWRLTFDFIDIKIVLELFDFIVIVSDKQVGL